jgi:hypothetical protein
MQSSIESEIQARVSAFASELVAIVRASALEVVQEALGDAVTPRAVRGRGAAAMPAAAPKAASGRGKGAKRDPQAIEALTNQLGAYIKKNPGQRIEQIGKELDIPTKELALPVKKLLGAKRITTKGQKRATTYFAR